MVIVKPATDHAKTMIFDLTEYQQSAMEKMCNGCILVGGVGSGKSRTALAYSFVNENKKDLYIITTARKRDTFEWEKELLVFPIKEKVVIDSWNNIAKYKNIKDAFFIFDEQRVIGNGTWVKSFLKIAKNNNWVLLTATPGDTWMDYIPVFVANGWYTNRTEFIRRHVIYNSFTKFPKVNRYIEVRRLIRLRDSIIVDMRYKKKTVSHHTYVTVPFDKEIFNTIMLGRWNVYDKKPIKDAGELCYLMRRVVNSDPRRIDILAQFLEKHPRIIVFYNFNYERDLLLELGQKVNVKTAQWNGHKHEPIPKTKRWMYIVQYMAGAEGWNCIETDTMIFFSPNYSYKSTIQAAGRIDRLNTPFTDLYYYHLITKSPIDLDIQKAFNNKRDFNEKRFVSSIKT